MYPNVTEPFVNYTRAQAENLTRFARSRDIAELTRLNIENFSKLIQESQSQYVEWLKSFSALASDAQGEWTKQFERVANATSNVVGTAASETAETAEESAKAAKRRG